MWDWQVFFGYFANTYLLTGAAITIGLTVVSMAGGLVLGCGLALMRLSDHRWLSLPARFYTWVFRGTPLLVQLMFIYTALPTMGIRLGVAESVILGLVLHEAAYLSEIVRSGIEAIPVGQFDAAKALGLRPRQSFRLVILPQATRIVIPALGNSVNGVLKATSVASTISMEELLRRTQQLMQIRFEVMELFAVASIYYLCMTTTWDMVQRRLERHYGRAYRT
jgi:polar amino acid transport system permease protein